MKEKLIEFSFNDEDMRYKFSVVYTDFRVTHPKLLKTLADQHQSPTYYYVFNKFDEKEDSYYIL
jgi:hypothetical protein